MTIRKLDELVNYIKHEIGNDGLLLKLQNYRHTLQVEEPNIKNITTIILEIRKYLTEIDDLGLSNALKKIIKRSTPFTMNDVLIDLFALNLTDRVDGDEVDYSDTIDNILAEITNNIEDNLIELDDIKDFITPYLDDQFKKIQGDNNAILAIIINEKKSSSNLNDFNKYLHKWDRALNIYQQLISTETIEEIKIIDFEKGSIEVIINLNYDIASSIMNLFNIAISAFSAYISYKTLEQTRLQPEFHTKELIELENQKLELLLQGIKRIIKNEISSQLHEEVKGSNMGDTNKKIDIVTEIIYHHVINDNNLKLISVPKEKKEEAKIIEDKRRSIISDIRKQYLLLSEEDRLMLSNKVNDLSNDLDDHNKSTPNN